MVSLYQERAGVPSALSGSVLQIKLSRCVKNIKMRATFVSEETFLLSSYYVLVQSLPLSKLCRTSRASSFTSRTAE